MNKKEYRQAMGSVVPDDYMETRMSQRVLSALEKKAPRRRPAAALIMAVMAALFVVSAGAVYAARSWSNIFEAYYTPTEELKLLLGDAMTEVNVSGVIDGFTVTATQVIGDKHSVCLAIEIQLPEDFDISKLYVDKDELKRVSEENGYKWDELVHRLINAYGYDENESEFWGGLAVERVSLYPVTATKEELLENYSDSFYLFDKSIEKSGGELTSAGGNTLGEHFDPETRTLSMMLISFYDIGFKGGPYTLVLDGIYYEDIISTCSAPGPYNFDSVTLSDELLVFNFDLDYTVYSSTYSIYEGGEYVGAVDLSPLSAYVEFLLTDSDETEYGTLEEAATKPKKDRFDGEWGHRRSKYEPINLTVHLSDGTTVAYNITSSGVGYTNIGYFLPEALFNLSDVDYVTMNGYTLELEN